MIRRHPLAKCFFGITPMGLECTAVDAGAWTRLTTLPSDLFDWM